MLTCLATDVATLLREQVRVIQSLPEPDEDWACEAYAASGFTHCGTLAYMRLRLSRSDAMKPAGSTVRDDVSIKPVQALGDIAKWRKRMVSGLEASYVDSLDCPELWGVRETADVLDSHLATGEFDPSLWWLVEHAHSAQGVALFNPMGDGIGCELVYVGIGPALRGAGLGRTLLSMGIATCAARGLREMTCAVDRRNAPALRLYESLGFREFARREAFVQRIAAH